MLELNLGIDILLDILLLFPVIPVVLALLCGFVQYLISAKIKDRVVRKILLVPLPALGGWLLWLLSQKPLWGWDFLGWDLSMVYVAAALAGTFLGWLLGWADRA